MTWRIVVSVVALVVGVGGLLAGNPWTALAMAFVIASQLCTEWNQRRRAAREARDSAGRDVLARLSPS
jgi:hypothetical protein